MNLELLERSLRRKYEVLSAPSPERALEILREERHTQTIAVILSDYRMPGMTGAELMAEAMKLHPEARRMIVTGYADSDNLIAAVNSGQIHYVLKKPWRHQDLHQVLDHMVGSFVLERELLSYKDGLTGLYNHRACQERLREEVARARRYNQPMSVLYADVDNFSALNEDLGYQIGDEVLRRLAHAISAEESTQRVRAC